MKFALLHPGAMGVTVGETLKASGHEVRWFTAGRSAQTLARAESAGFIACGRPGELFDGVDAVVSVCPPGAALALAVWVREQGYQGPYLDANAVSPLTVRAMAAVVHDGFVDGGIIGPPARTPGTTRLYLSGSGSGAVRAAGWFAAGPLQAVAMEGAAGAASALKMCYAAYTKGLSALLLTVRALADAEGVAPTLLAEWELSQPGLAERSALLARGTAGKAWRFIDEMNEIVETLESRNLPGGFHRAAAEVYERMAPLKSLPDSALDDVLLLLSQAGPARSER